MTKNPSSPIWRGVPAASAAVSRVSLVPCVRPRVTHTQSNLSNQRGSRLATTQTDANRPFSFRAPDEQLADLRRRMNATNWPERGGCAAFAARAIGRQCPPNSWELRGSLRHERFNKASAQENVAMDVLCPI
jgi:hypothetical protein